MPADDRSVLDIVSLTPMSLSNDSRTLKQVMSVHRFGYRSAVVEGPPSDAAKLGLPMEVIATIFPSEEKAKPAAPEASGEADCLAVDAVSPACAAPPKTKKDVVRAHLAEVRKNATGHDGEAAGGGQRDTADDYDLFQKLKVKFFLVISKLYYFLLRVSIKLYYLMAGGYYLVVRLIDVIKIKIRMLSNRLIYNDFTAFLRHVKNYINSYVRPTYKLLPQAKLYYIHSPYQYPAVWLKSLFSKSKHIYDAHDFYSNMETPGLVSSFWSRWVVPFESFIERRCIRGASAVVTVNDGLANLIAQKFGVTPVVLRNSHDPRLDEPAGTDIRAALGLGADDVIIVCVGNWKRENGVSSAIEAMVGLEERCHLVFLGGGYPSYAGQIEAMGLSGRVHFLPPVSPTQVAPFIATADLSLILYHDGAPGIRWSLPNRFFQPVAAGLPILYPDLPEIARLAREFQLGLSVDTLDPESIRSGVRGLTGDGALLEACRRNAKAASSALSWEQDELKLRALIEDVIGPPASLHTGAAR